MLHGETASGGQRDSAGAHILTSQPAVGAEF